MMDLRNSVRNLFRTVSNLVASLYENFRKNVSFFKSLELSIKVQRIMTLLFVVLILGFIVKLQFPLSEEIKSDRILCRVRDY